MSLPEEGKEHPTPHQAGTYQLELQGLEALVSDTHEGDDQPYADHTQAHVENDVCAAGSLELVPIDGPGVGPPLGGPGLGHLNRGAVRRGEYCTVYILS